MLPHAANPTPRHHPPRLRPLIVLALAALAACEGVPTDPDAGPVGRQAAPPMKLPAPQEGVVGPGVREAVVGGSPAYVIVSLSLPAAVDPRGGGPVDLPGLTRAVAAAQSRVLEAAGSEFGLRRRYQTIPSLSARLDSEAALDRLARHPLVTGIHLDLPGEGTLGTSVPWIGADLRHDQGNEGEGVVVAVLDTGADTDHPDLSDDIDDRQACFGDNDGALDGAGFCPGGGDRETGSGSGEDDQGHGTHVSGIVSSRGTVSSPGVAPGAQIVPIKVLDSGGVAGRFFFFSEIVAAWDYIAANNDDLGIQVINMSLSTSATYAGNCDATFPSAVTSIATLNGLGISVFAAAGNNVGSQIGSPACLTGVIAVGASDNADNVPSFSSTNSTIDVFAPGSGILSLDLAGSTSTKSGTSMASPHAAGCAALLLEAGDATSPTQVETRLETSPFTVTVDDNTFPRIDCRPDGRGTVQITKLTTPADRTGFNFTDNIAAPNSFVLDHGETETFSDVVVGSYTVTESGPGPFFELSGLVCEDPDGGTTTDLASATASIDLDDGETVSCTYTNSDLPPTVEAAPSTQTIQYSDEIQDITVTARDSDQDALTASFSWSATGGAPFAGGLPAGLAAIAAGCSASGGVQTCTWTLSGTAGLAAGTYTIRSTVTDDDGETASVDVTLVVEAEDATVAFDPGNPVAIPVTAPGGDSEAFTLTVYVEETEPDLAAVAPAPGDPQNAILSASLVPIAPGSPVTGSCALDGVTGSGYDRVATFICSFDGVPVNTYSAEMTVEGGYYTGFGDDVVSVVDPSLGFTTGGGTFAWPETGERTNFGYTMKYTPNGRRVRGSLLVIRHHPDGSRHRLKSNALGGLSLGSAADFEWASFTGKATYSEPGWEDAVGNHEFVVYVEDRGEPGAGADRFWIRVLDQDDAVVPALSLETPATDNAQVLTGGNLVVPHQTGKRR